ncbi:MAG TPA: ATP-binding protein [Bacteroidota bacterium]|nr:ATP-binding protein [Bacteroidota bacterium]
MKTSCIGILFIVVFIISDRAWGGREPIPDAAPCVLILNSYHTGYSWSDAETRGICSVLKKQYPSLSPAIEYLDCKHFATMKHFEKQKDLLVEKYGDGYFSLVIVMDNPALEFAVKYRAELFSSTPIVFCGINGYEPSMLQGQKNIAGILEDFDVEGTTRLMMNCHPEATDYVILHDWTVTGILARTKADEVFRSIDHTIKLHFIADQNAQAIIDTVRHLTPGTVILLLPFTRDKAGRVFDLDEFAAMLSKNSPVPIYSVHEAQLGSGIVGGSLIGGESHGRQAGQMAVNILSGRSCDSMSITGDMSFTAGFDNAQLIRFGIPLSLLPESAVIINRPESFYTRNKELVIKAVVIFVTLIVLILILSVNIIRRKRAEHALRESARTLVESERQLLQSQKLEGIGRLAGGIAHDFNNLLAMVLGSAELLRKRLDGQPALHKHIDRIIEASERGTSISRQLLIFSRPDQAEFKPISLTQIITGLVEMLHHFLPKSIVIIYSGGCGKNDMINGDAGQIHQALLNLAINARDAMKNRGTLGIRQTRVDAAFITQRFKHDASGAYAAVSMSDTGTGMDAATLGKIFEPFFSTKPQGKGTGLGLSIVHGIVKNHQAFIDIDSAVGRGTTFTLYFPLLSDKSRSE